MALHRCSVVLAFATSLILTTGFAAAQSWIHVLENIDVSSDPAVAHFASESQRAPPQVADDLRWNLDVAVEYGWQGEAAASASGGITLPVWTPGVRARRAQRARIERELSALERDDLARDTIYGVIDLLCRWGYLAAVEPALERLAQVPGRDGIAWSTRHANATAERRALRRQLRVHAPRVLVVIDGRHGFLCRFPPPPAGRSLDGLDGHPSLRRVDLEAQQQAQLSAFASSVGEPELSFEGSVRYSFEGPSLDADVRVSARIPFSLHAAYGAVDAEVDPRHARVGVSVGSSGQTLEVGPAPDLARTLEAERAAIAYQIASATGVAELLAVQDGLAHEQSPPAVSAVIDRSCVGLCSTKDTEGLPLAVLPSALDLLSLAYDTARAQLDLLRTLAIDPATLADGRQ